MVNAEQFPLRDFQILVAEDEYLIAADIAQTLERHGAEVVGPVSTVTDAYRLASYPNLSGAVLDLNLRGEMIWPVADLLLARRVPIVFLTGYPNAFIAQRYRQVPYVSKPLLHRLLVTAFTERPCSATG